MVNDNNYQIYGNQNLRYPPCVTFIFYVHNKYFGNGPDEQNPNKASFSCANISILTI